MRERMIELLQDIDHYPEKTCPKYRTGEECGDCQYKLDTEKGCDLYARKVDYLIAKDVIAMPELEYKQTLYFIYQNKVHPLEVSSYMIRPEFTIYFKFICIKMVLMGVVLLMILVKQYFSQKRRQNRH